MLYRRKLRLTIITITIILIVGNIYQFWGIFEYLARNGTAASDTLNVEPEKTPILLAIGVFSNMIAIERRKAIRSTWFKRCDSSEVICRFFHRRNSSLPIIGNKIYAGEKQ